MAITLTLHPGSTTGYFVYEGKTYQESYGTKPMLVRQTYTGQFGFLVADLNLSTPTATDYIFTGWSRFDDNIPTIKTNTISVDTDGSAIHIYACWDKSTYTISFDGNANNVTNIPNSQIKNYNSDLVLPTTIPIRSGYTFLGWATSSTATIAEYQPGEAFSINEDTILYAVWELETYSLTFFSNGGNFESGATSFVKTYPANTVLNLIDFNTDDPLIKNRKGYKFIGWNTDAAAKEGLEQYITISSNLQSLYAIWKLSSNTYIYIDNSWKVATPYVYKDGTWKTAQSKIYNGEWSQ